MMEDANASLIPDCRVEEESDIISEDFIKDIDLVSDNFSSVQLSEHEDGRKLRKLMRQQQLSRKQEDALKKIANYEHETEKKRSLFGKACHKVKSCFKFLWNAFPLGSVRLPLFYNGHDSYSNSLFKCAGCFLLLMFLSYVYYILKAFGDIEGVFIEYTRFRSNDDLARKFTQIRYYDSQFLVSMVLFNSKKEDEEKR